MPLAAGKLPSMDNSVNDGLEPALSSGAQNSPSSALTVSIRATVVCTWTIPSGVARIATLAALVAAVALVLFLLTRVAAPALRVASSASGAASFIPVYA